MPKLHIGYYVSGFYVSINGAPVLKCINSDRWSSQFRPAAALGYCPSKSAAIHVVFFSVLLPADYWTTGRRSMSFLKHNYFIIPILQERNDLNHDYADGSDTYRGSIKLLNYFVSNERWPESGKSC